MVQTNAGEEGSEKSMKNGSLVATGVYGGLRNDECCSRDDGSF